MQTGDSLSTVASKLARAPGSQRRKHLSQDQVIINRDLTVLWSRGLSSMTQDSHCADLKPQDKAVYPALSFITPRAHMSV